MKQLFKYLPNLNDIQSGVILMALGIMLMYGGGFAIRLTLESELVWVDLPILDSWICWIIIWYGFDALLCKSKATTFIILKLIYPICKPIIENLISKERLEWLSARFKGARK